jgi:hypothetical protein
MLCGRAKVLRYMYIAYFFQLNAVQVLACYRYWTKILWCGFFLYNVTYRMTNSCKICVSYVTVL